VAIDLDTRERVWEPIELTDVNRGGVTVDGDRAYVADAGGEVFAIDVTSGDVAWSQPVGGPVDGAPAVADEAVIVAVRGTANAPGAAIVALEAADGSERWRLDIDAQVVTFASAPSVGGDVALAAFSDGTVRAFGLADGRERWTARPRPGSTPTLFDSAVSSTDGAAFVTDSAGITGSAYRIELSTGRVTWDFAINEPMIRGAPVISGGSLLVATTDGSLNALDPSTGERIWRSARPGALSGIAPAGSVVVATRGGPRAGLDAFAPDPNGRLEREASPTTPRYLSILATFALAGVPLAAGAIVGGRLLANRMGPAFEEEEADA
jgi:outer membrane protein assembly factor BamB